MKKILLATAISLLSLQAMAGTGTIAVTPGSGSTYQTTTNAATNNLGNITLWDYSAGANGAGVTINHELTVGGAGTAGTPSASVVSVQGVTGGNPVPVSGYESGPVTVTATPANSSHAAGTSVGGLFTIPLARIAGGTGAVTQLAFTSTGGSTGQYVVRVWDKQPTSTTCTDNTAFAGNFATDDANLITPFFSIAPIPVTVTTGDSASYVALTNLNWDYKNADSTPSQNLYVCIITVLTDTLDDNKPVRLMMSGPQN